MSRSSESRKARRLAALLAGLGTILLLAACGGSGHDPSSTEAAAEQKAEKRLADFAHCLREHGVKAETSTGAKGNGIKIDGGNGGPQAMEAAQNACKKYRPEPKKVNLSPQQKVEQEEGVRKFAACMREHGITVHASTAGGGIQVSIQSASKNSGPNPESPAFQKAQESCQHLMPGPPGAKKGSGAPEHTTSKAPGGASESGASLQSEG